MHITSWLPRLGLSALCATVACGGSSDPTGPDPDVNPTTELRWDMDVIVRYVKASSNKTCDGDGTLGLGNPGEYQYQITAFHGGITKTHETNNYGSVFGEDVELDKAEIHNFTNQTWKFTNLKSGEGVALTMRVTEWDGTEKDSYMNNRADQLSVNPSSLLPTGGTRTDRALGIGNQDCGLTLYYDITAIQRSVTVN